MELSIELLYPIKLVLSKKYAQENNTDCPINKLFFNLIVRTYLYMEFQNGI